MKRKILVWTSTRAEYGILTPVMDAIQNHHGLKLKVLASGMHMEEKFGDTIQLIREKFPEAYSFKMDINDDTCKATLEGMAQCMVEASKKFNEINPDIFLYLGDRFETYAAATAAVVNLIPTAHIHGGDKTKAGLDESFRHALTKISNIHFAATPKSAQRIKKLGEKPEYIFYVGSPSMDTILHKKIRKKREIFKEYSINAKTKLALVIQHPETMQPNLSGIQMNSILEALEEEGLEALVVYPNNDPGHNLIIEEIEKRRGNKKIHIYKDIPHIDYLSFLASSDLLIGNSSSGMIDASAFPIPVINVGERQRGRERGTNVIDVSYNKQEIKKAVKKALNDNDFKEKIKKPKSPYGNGTAGKQIAEILYNIKIDQNLMQKQIAY